MQDPLATESPEPAVLLAAESVSSTLSSFTWVIPASNDSCTRSCPGDPEPGARRLERLTVVNGNRFTFVPSADAAILEMRDLASPVAAFVSQRCEVNASLQIEADRLYTSE